MRLITENDEKSYKCTYDFQFKMLSNKSGYTCKNVFSRYQFCWISYMLYVRVGNMRFV